MRRRARRTNRPIWEICRVQQFSKMQIYQTDRPDGWYQMPPVRRRNSPEENEKRAEILRLFQLPEMYVCLVAETRGNSC